MAKNQNLSRALPVLLPVLGLVLTLLYLQEGASLSAVQVGSHRGRGSGGEQEKMSTQEVENIDASSFTVAAANSAEIRFVWEPLSIVFRSADGKESTILFTEDGVGYSGDVPFDRSTKMFFNLFWKEYILKEHLKAKCTPNP